MPGNAIHRIRYFTARVADRAGDHQQQRQQAYLRALATHGHLTIHLGHFLSRVTRMPLAHPQPGGPLTVEVMKTEEKGSGVNLATHLLLDAFRRDCQVAAVLSNDSDLKEPVAPVQSELSVTVGIINPHPAGQRSRALPSAFFKQVRPRDLAVCQFPAVLHDANGTIHKPAGW